MKGAIPLPRLPPAVARARGRHNALKRHRGADDPATLAAEAELKAARLAAAIKREVDRSPPLTAEQIERLRGLLPAPTASSDHGTEPDAARSGDAA